MARPRSILAGPRAALQRGMATVLIMLLVGMSLTVAVMAGIYATQASQAVAVAMHGQTQAQLRAWTGAEAVRAYLNQLSTDGQLKAFAVAINASANKALTLGGLSGVTATLAGATFSAGGDPTQLIFNIRGTTASGTLAESASTLRAVYAVDAGAGSGGSGSGSGSQAKTPLTFNRNLKLSGSVSVQTDASETRLMQVNVKGDLDTDGNSLSGFGRINATGSVSIGSSSSFQEINANCDVNLGGSVRASKVSARRNVCIANGGVSVSATAGGSVTAKSGYADNGALYAIGNATGVSACRASGSNANNSTGEAATCDAPAVNGVNLSLQGGGGAKTVATKGSVKLSSGRIGRLDANGSLDLTNTSGTVDSGSIGGSLLNKPNWNNSVNVTVVPGYSATVPAPVTVVVDSPTFNANSIEALANYAFKVDGNGFIKVTVRNVSGLTDGTYFLGDYGGGQRDYLCTALTVGSGPTTRTCATPATAAATKKICKGQSDYNYCMSYAGGTWSLVGTSLAPGVAWFQGHLSLQNGSYYNTFIATGNIATGGSHRTYAPNYIGHAGTCSNADYPLLKPTQFCSGASYVVGADGGIGNFALLAGSRSDGNFADGAGYIGGNISLGGNTEIFGSIVAGNEFSSGGSSTIHGGIGSLSLGLKVNNALTGSTTIDLRGLPSTFDPFAFVPGNAPASSGTGSVRLKWSRYL